MIIEKNKGCNLPLEKKCKFHTQANIIMVYYFIKTKSLGLFELKYVHLVNEFRERIRNVVENNTQNRLYKQHVFPAPQRFLDFLYIKAKIVFNNYAVIVKQPVNLKLRPLYIN